MRLNPFRPLVGDRRGGAGVEFALIAPIMVLLYCGLAEVTLAMMAERRAAHAVSVVADLVAQSTSMNPTQMTDIFTVADAILKPFPAAPMKIRVTSVKADNQGTPRVIWSKGHSYGARSDGAAVSEVPAGLLAVNESVVMAEVTYQYDSPLKYALPDALSFSQTFYLKPRKSPEVLWVAS